MGAVVFFQQSAVHHAVDQVSPPGIEVYGVAHVLLSQHSLWSGLC